MYHKRGPYNRRGYQLARLIALVSKIQRHSDKAPPSQNNNDSTGDALARYTLSLTIATWVVAGAAILSFGAALLQWSVLKSTDASAERSSTAGRAYIFIKPEIALSDNNPLGALATGPYRPSIRFSIKNFGQTPAIITKVETHLYLTNTFGTEEPPDPSSPAALASIEAVPGNIGPVDYPRAASTGNLEMLSVDTREDGNPLRIVFAGGAESGPLEQKFVFLRGVHVLQGAWFYCSITYQDIFGEKDRHTWLYARIGGTGFTYPKSQKYNHWD
jgi:hypothetical protein